MLPERVNKSKQLQQVKKTQLLFWSTKVIDISRLFYSEHFRSLQLITSCSFFNMNKKSIECDAG